MKVSTEIDNNFGYEKNYAAGRQYHEELRTLFKLFCVCVCIYVGFQSF